MRHRWSRSYWTISLTLENALQRFSEKLKTKKDEKHQTFACNYSITAPLLLFWKVTWRETKFLQYSAIRTMPGRLSKDKMEFKRQVSGRNTLHWGTDSNWVVQNYKDRSYHRETHNRSRQTFSTRDCDYVRNWRTRLNNARNTAVRMAGPD